MRDAFQQFSSECRDDKACQGAIMARRYGDTGIEFPA